METGMTLVPDAWEDPRDTPLQLIGEDAAPPQSPSCPPAWAGAGA